MHYRSELVHYRVDTNHYTVLHVHYVYQIKLLHSRDDIQTLEEWLKLVDFSYGCVTYSILHPSPNDF